MAHTTGRDWPAYHQMLARVTGTDYLDQVLPASKPGEKELCVPSEDTTVSMIANCAYLSSEREARGRLIACMQRFDEVIQFRIEGVSTIPQKQLLKACI